MRFYSQFLSARRCGATTTQTTVCVQPGKRDDSRPISVGLLQHNKYNKDFNKNPFKINASGISLRSFL